MVPRQSGLPLRLVGEISLLTARLVEIGLVDDQNVVAHRLLPDSRWAVTQPGADMSIALKKQPYVEIYGALVGSGNYAMQLLDGALIQMSYSGDDRGIDRHRLAYLPAHDLEPFQTDPELYLGEHHFIDVVGHQVMPVPLRFDYDSRDGVARDIIHPVSHLTLGQYQHCRIPATGPVTPSAFVSFILASFYSTPTQAQEHFISEVEFGEITITRGEESRTHVMVA